MSETSEMIEVPAKEVRLPQVATEALAQGRGVIVTRYGKPIHVVLSEGQFASVAPLLEVLTDGATVSPEMQMTRDDIDLMRDLADDRDVAEEEQQQIDELLAHEQG